MKHLDSCFAFGAFDIVAFDFNQAALDDPMQRIATHWDSIKDRLWHTHLAVGILFEQVHLDELAILVVVNLQERMSALGRSL